MSLPKWSILLLAALVFTTAAVAQQAQVQAKGLQQPPTAKLADDVKPTCSSVDANTSTDSNSAVTQVREFDVLNVERSLGFDGSNWRRTGAAPGKPDAQPQVCSASCLKKCGECPTCGHGELWDCTTCSCMPI
jgi:hypothetical protein